MNYRSTFTVALGLAAVGGLAGCKRGSDVEKPASAPKQESTVAETKPATAPVLQKVVGRWLREDGGYVLEVLGAEPGGTLRVAYFNPNPITVGRAAWLESAGALQLLVELTGSGYNGSTYVLRYDAATDRLVGEYRQAVQRQTYQIEFVRQTAPIAR